MNGFKDPDNSLMAFLVIILFLRSCAGCETKELENKIDKLNDKIDSINVVRK